MLPKTLDSQSYSYVTNFLCKALEPWTEIEGAELGDSQTKVLEATGYDDEINLSLMLILDRAIRSMVNSEWFQEMLEEEQPPYDFYRQSVNSARAEFNKVKHDAIAACKQFPQHGGKEAEEWINAYEPI